MTGTLGLAFASRATPRGKASSSLKAAQATGPCGSPTRSATSARPTSSCCHLMPPRSNRLKLLRASSRSRRTQASLLNEACLSQRPPMSALSVQSLYWQANWGPRLPRERLGAARRRAVCRQEPKYIQVTDLMLLSSDAASFELSQAPMGAAERQREKKAIERGSLKRGLSVSVST